MGVFQVTGPGATRFLNAVLTNDIQKLQPGHGQYTLLCNETGGVVDDLYVFYVDQVRGRQDLFVLIVNASRTEADFEWLRQQRERLRDLGPFDLLNVSGHNGALAVQGPAAAGFIDKIVNLAHPTAPPMARPSQLKKNQVTRCLFGDEPGLISRTGYTGEDGFEILVPAQVVSEVWGKVMRAGQASGLKPVGLGARDTLRLEACYPLYGHELDEHTTPIEAGLKRFVCLDKGDFPGREALARQVATGVSKKLTAFRMVEQAPPPRSGYAVFSSKNTTDRTGTVTSGTLCPSVGIGAGLAYVRPEHARPGMRIAIEIRGRRFAAETTAKPLYTPRPKHV
jgi:aminomethyltransferase